MLKVEYFLQDYLQVHLQVNSLFTAHILQNSIAKLMDMTAQLTCFLSLLNIDQSEDFIEYCLMKYNSLFVFLASRFLTALQECSILKTSIFNENMNSFLKVLLINCFLGIHENFDDYQKCLYHKYQLVFVPKDSLQWENLRTFLENDPAESSLVEPNALIFVFIVLDYHCFSFPHF